MGTLNSITDKASRLQLLVNPFLRLRVHCHPHRNHLRLLNNTPTILRPLPQCHQHPSSPDAKYSQTNILYHPVQSIPVTSSSMTSQVVVDKYKYKPTMSVTSISGPLLGVFPFPYLSMLALPTCNFLLNF